jgi:hypothetical protein
MDYFAGLDVSKSGSERSVGSTPTARTKYN